MIDDVTNFLKGNYIEVRKKIECLMTDLNGRHLRILDDYTFEILSDYINKDVK